MILTPQRIAMWAALGAALSCLFAAVLNIAWFLLVGFGAWLMGGWLAQKLIEQEDEDE